MNPYREPSDRLETVIRDGADNAEISSEVAHGVSMYARHYYRLMRRGELGLLMAHQALENIPASGLDLMQIAGLAQAAQIYQSQS